jgi:hypothetical protein
MSKGDFTTEKGNQPDSKNRLSDHREDVRPALTTKVPGFGGGALRAGCFIIRMLIIYTAVIILLGVAVR